MSPAEDMILDAAERGPVILVAEDEVLVRLAVAEHLRECGFVVIEAATGEEARSVFLSGHEIDLVFSDIQMSGPFDGVALAQWLSVYSPDIPVVLTSGAGAAMEHARAACAQVKQFIAKPYEYRLLAESLRRHLARRAKLS
jgi:CheY-like chemotaxis protein